MAYSLSFNKSFFMTKGDYDLDTSDMICRNPTTCYQAILAMTNDQYEEMCKEVFCRDAKSIDVDMVLDKIRKTNTCSNLSSPVKVWIDSEGYYTIDVYDNEEN